MVVGLFSLYDMIHALKKDGIEFPSLWFSLHPLLDGF